MPKGCRTYLPEQDLLLPPSLRAWLEEDHLVYFVSDVVDQLDLSAIHAVNEKEKRGQPPYDPRLMYASHEHQRRAGRANGDEEWSG